MMSYITKKLHVQSNLAQPHYNSFAVECVNILMSVEITETT